ncbi:MAG TPA: hypothetical protein VK816_05150 [Jatrophihabitantaceae bacterium]|jgi:hypothetical protein|nr:hypothetical protein [Jatrophihabitantaceae bacterium]
MKRHLLILIVVAGFGVAVNAIADLSTANAAGGNSNTVIDGLTNLPADGVAYPVATSEYPYTKEAGATQVLTKDLTTTLTASDTTSTTDQVTTTWTIGGSLSISFQAFKDFPNAGVWGSFSGAYSSAHMNGKTTTFSVSDTITVTPAVDGVTAVPVYYEVQQWGGEYTRDPDTRVTTAISTNSMYDDVAVGEGWLLSCSGKACVPGVDFNVSAK